MTDMIQIHVIIKGRVQGVFYRASTKNEADRLGITGWARNLPTGDVEAVFQGSASLIDQMLDWCAKGPPVSRVDEIIKEHQRVEPFADFEVRY